MKKEVLIAVLIGLSMGLVITYGIYRVQSSLNQPPVADVSDQPDVSSTNNNEASTVLSIHTPTEGTIQSSSTTTITGTTTPDSNVVIFINDDDHVVVSDQSGSFTLNTSLDNGTNLITVYVISDTGDVVKEERLLVVTDVYEKSSKNTKDDKDTESEISDSDESGSMTNNTTNTEG